MATNVLIDWSGGLDSTLLLLNALINASYDAVHYTSMNFLNNKIKNEREEQARNEIVSIINMFKIKNVDISLGVKLHREDAPVEYTIRGNMLSYLPLQYFNALSAAQTISTIERRIDEVQFGHIGDYDDYWQIRQQCESLFTTTLEYTNQMTRDINPDACIQSPIITYPLRFVPKVNILNSYYKLATNNDFYNKTFIKKILSKTVTCEKPDIKSKNTNYCTTDFCEKCTELANSLLLLKPQVIDFYKGIPVFKKLVNNFVNNKHRTRRIAQWTAS